MRRNLDVAGRRGRVGLATVEAAMQGSVKFCRIACDGSRGECLSDSGLSGICGLGELKATPNAAQECDVCCTMATVLEPWWQLVS